MTNTDADIVLRSTAMYKDITLNFKDWNEMSRNKNDDDAYGKLHELIDDALIKADIKIVKIICNMYGVIEMMNWGASNLPEDWNELGGVKNIDKMYLMLIYTALLEAVCKDFPKEMDDKEYSDSECEESDEDL